MAEAKTKPTRASVAEYLASRASPAQMADCKALMAMFKRVTQARPTMWGPSMVGYGRHAYRYESGRTGEAPVAAFAVRGRELVVYLLPDSPNQAKLLARLGKHKMFKSCLYLKRLADVDTQVLESLVVTSMEEFRRRYPGGGDA
jgi:hypothetical protein